MISKHPVYSEKDSSTHATIWFNNGVDYSAVNFDVFISTLLKKCRDTISTHT